MEGYVLLGIGAGVLVGLVILVKLVKWLRRGLRELVAGVKVQLFTTESFLVATLYNCVVIGLTGIVYGIKMMIGG